METTIEKIQKPSAGMPSAYPKLLSDLKDRIRVAQIKVNLNVNRELVRLYWEIGETIVERQKNENWGARVIEKLGEDLQKAFPGIEGFSRRNIFRMRAFYQSYQTDKSIKMLERLWNE